MNRIKCFMLEPTGETVTREFDAPLKGSTTSPLYRRSDTGEIITLNQAPPGAMYYCDWLLNDDGKPLLADWYHVGEDGKVLAVMTPGGVWIIDQRASNCDMPKDNDHACWVRHGVPPEITVDKAGKTCHAGAGSIQCGNYHGFLRNGYLEEA